MVHGGQPRSSQAGAVNQPPVTMLVPTTMPTTMMELHATMWMHTTIPNTMMELHATMLVPATIIKILMVEHHSISDMSISEILADTVIVFSSIESLQQIIDISLRQTVDVTLQQTIDI